MGGRARGRCVGETVASAAADVQPLHVTHTVKEPAYCAGKHSAHCTACSTAQHAAQHSMLPAAQPSRSLANQNSMLPAAQPAGSLANQKRVSHAEE